MSAWNQILSAALVGTDRRPCVLGDEMDPALSKLLPSGHLDAEGLLHAAGSFALAVRVSADGMTLPVVSDAVATVSGDVPPATHDERERVPLAASRRLATILSGSRSDDNMRLIMEWLTFAEETGRRVPYNLLPALLDVGVRRRDARRLVLKLGGPRARWLAAHDLERWPWVARSSGEEDGEPSELIEVSDRSLWDDGDMQARVAYLTALRAQDPAAGRDLLLESWGELRATDLALLIPVMRDTVEPEDEEWLEQALDAGVRARDAAAELLVKLPDSGLKRRMRDRIRSWVSEADGILHVTLPQTLDADMKRDGIVAQSPLNRQGPRSWWFEQVVSAAPLDVWAGFADDLADLAHREVVPDLGPELCRGLARAVAHQKDFVLSARLATDPRAGGAFPQRFVQTLESDAAKIVAIALLQSEGDHVPRLDLVLEQVTAPWPDDLSDAVFDYLTPPYGQGNRWVNNVVVAARHGLGLARMDRVREIANSLTERQAPDIKWFIEAMETLVVMRDELHSETTIRPS